MPQHFHPSVHKAFAALRERWPKAKLAAFGQTVFWDEPMKAVLAPMLEAHYPAARLLVGPHDADYFGRCPGLAAGERFVVREHNDADTRDMWAAAGEVAALFGAEKVPTASLLAQHGVSVQKLRSAKGDAYGDLIRACTTAWGWRGVVDAADARSVFADIETADAGPAVLAALRWAVDTTLAHVEADEARRAEAAGLIDAFQRQLAAPEHPKLAQAFAAMWPVLYERLLGYAPKNVSLTSTCDLFRFNTRTCRRPRFKLLRHFLNVKTAAVCRDAYSEAVAGGGMYELEHFGAGALPFDLVVPGRGRGTLSLSGRHLVVDTDPHIVVDLPRGAASVAALAEAIEAALGPDCALVGKAVALAFMITSEFVFVLNVEGSTYVPRTRALAARLREAGLAVDLCPVLRLHYRTWDSLRRVDGELRLPAHLADAFGAEAIRAKDFARQWPGAVKQCRRKLKALSRAQRPQDLMALLAHEEHPEWLRRLEEYVAGHTRLLDAQRRVDDLKHRADALRERERELKAELGKLERLRGKISRLVKPLAATLADLERKQASPGAIRQVREELICYRDGELPELDRRLDGLRQERRRVQSERGQVVRQYRAVETGPEVRELRQRIQQTELEAEAARLRMASDLLKTDLSLPYTNHRPTAWWLPVVAPRGDWFRAILRTTAVEIEVMTPQL